MDLINASGTSFPHEDTVELSALKKVFGSKKEDVLAGKISDQLDIKKAGLPMITSNKGNLGNLGIASGLTELVFAVQSMLEGKVSGTGNLKESRDQDLNILKDGEIIEKKDINKILKLSFGQGITSAAIAV